MNTKHGVIFDMDGVIFDTERLWEKAFESANEEYGLNLSEEYRQSTCGKNEVVIREELLSLCPDLDVNKYRDSLVQSVKALIDSGSFEIKPGFAAFIEFLHINGFKTGLATSSNKERANKLFSLKGLKIEKLFDTAVFGDDIGNRSKPDPYIFELACSGIGLLPENCFIIEDSINGIEAAYRGGFSPIMLVDLIEPNDYCRAHAFAITKDFAEVERIMRRILC